MRKAWNWSRLMLLLPAVVGMVSVSEAVDLQGTWDATAKCTLYPNGANPEKLIPVKGTIQISQSGQELAFNTSLLGNYQAFEWDDPVHIHKAVVGGGICPSPGFPALLGLFGTVTTAQDGDGASMAIDMNGATIEGPVKCHVTAQRTSAADPVVTTCPACSFAITPTRTNRSAADGSSTVAVSTGSGCAWSASNLGVSWLSVSPAAGTGPGTVTVSVDANAARSSRSATISIAGQSFAVDQAAAPCSFAITPTSTTQTGAGGSVEVSVSTDSECTWSASNLGVSWISVSPAAGTGPATVTVSVAVNGRAAPARTATISIATRAFKVTQRGE